LGGGYTGPRATWGDVFYFGNAIGNTGAGDTAVNSTVNAIDESGARTNPAALGDNIPITNLYDFNRTANVTALDQSISRNNATNLSTVVKYLNLADPPLAPEGDGADAGGGVASPALATDSGSSADTASGHGGVASALTASAPASSEVSIPRWLGLRLDEVDLNSGRVVELLRQLAEWKSPTARKVLMRADRIADSLDLEHALLDSIFADLGLA
jgi:hypothetical protein